MGQITTGLTRMVSARICYSAAESQILIDGNDTEIAQDRLAACPADFGSILVDTAGHQVGINAKGRLPALSWRVEFPDRLSQYDIDHIAGRDQVGDAGKHVYANREAPFARRKRKGQKPMIARTDKVTLKNGLSAPDGMPHERADQVLTVGR
jgi:hypothetical protein